MPAAFQLIGAQFAGDGAFGSSGFGEGPFGGEDHHTYELPPLHHPSDDPLREDNVEVHEVEHRRDGKLLARRKYAETRRWDFNYIAIPHAVVDRLKPFYQARRFRFLPDSLDETTFVIVVWVATGWHPERLRSATGLYNLPFSIEEAA